MPYSPHYPVLSKAIERAAQQLATFPSRAPHTICLRAVLLGVERDFTAWAVNPPEPRQHQQMVRLVLAIHFALRQLGSRP